MLGSWERVTRGRDTPTLLPTGEDSRSWLPAGSTAVHLKHRLVSPPTYICVIYWTPRMCTNRTGPCQAEESILDLSGSESGPPDHLHLWFCLCLCLRGSRGESSSTCFSLEPGCSSTSQRVWLPLRNGDNQLGKQTTGFRDKEGLSCPTAYPLGN